MNIPISELYGGVTNMLIITFVAIIVALGGLYLSNKEMVNEILIMATHNSTYGNMRTDSGFARFVICVYFYKGRTKAPHVY